MARHARLDLIMDSVRCADCGREFLKSQQYRRDVSGVVRCRSTRQCVERQTKQAVGLVQAARAAMEKYFS